MWATIAVLSVLCIIADSWGFLSSYLGLPLHKSHNSMAISMSLKVALTREDGANDKVLNLLGDVDCFEIPCIMFDSGPDSDKLEEFVSTVDTIAITSPYAASVFLKAWRAIGSPQTTKVVTVGKGTSKPLIEAGLIPAFEPSDSTAATLAKEVPLSLGNSVLYPASALADNKLESGLTDRGFKVTRLNTYTTVPAVWSEDTLKLAKSMDVVAFASPSAIRTWVERVGTSAIAVAIGPTSASAAKKAGFAKVYSPEVGSKGVGPWAALIEEVALQSQ